MFDKIWIVELGKKGTYGCLLAVHRSRANAIAYALTVPCPAGKWISCFEDDKESNMWWNNSENTHALSVTWTELKP